MKETKRPIPAAPADGHIDELCRLLRRLCTVYQKRIHRGERIALGAWGVTVF